MSKDTLNEVAVLFNAAKYLFKCERYELSYEIDMLATNDYLCGTDNVNADMYVMMFFQDEISVEEMIKHLTYPNEEDRRIL